MNCPELQQHVLESEQPSRLSAPARLHLIKCSSCWSWHRRILEVEQIIRGLPVPPSNGPEYFVAQVRTGEVVPRECVLQPAPAPPPVIDPTTPKPAGWIRTLREKALQKLALASSLAAALLFFTLAWWFWPHSPQPTTEPTFVHNAADPLASFKAERDELLARAQSPRQRVEALAGYANDLRDRARTLAERKDHAQLEHLARFYKALVCTDLLAHAGTLSKEEQHQVLRPIVLQLEETESEMQRRIREDRSGANSLLVIATSARQAHNQLVGLMA
jgi:hypothetical protein